MNQSYYLTLSLKGLSSTSTEDDQNPLLWCGLSNGSICVYEASTWLTAWQQIKAKDKVVSLIKIFYLA